MGIDTSPGQATTGVAPEKERKESVMIRKGEEIKRDLIDELYWDYRVDASDVKAGVSDGKVTLTGTVPSYYARGRAHDSAAYTLGVLEVDNQIVVT
jgi:hyperosmotically inducible protein